MAAQKLLVEIQLRMRVKLYLSMTEGVKRRV